MGEGDDRPLTVVVGGDGGVVAQLLEGDHERLDARRRPPDRRRHRSSLLPADLGRLLAAGAGRRRHLDQHPGEQRECRGLETE